MINYVTFGQDCVSASALRNLDLRKVALPFDWIISNIDALEQCFKDDFAYFHKELKLNDTKTKMIDKYGFIFPHDYPLNDEVYDNMDIGEGLFGEESGKIITNNWTKHYDIVLEKYNRRIERFRNIMNDTTPIIALCNYNTNDVLKLQRIIMKYYNKDNIYFINSHFGIFKNNKIMNINTEINGIYNDTNIWRESVISLTSYLETI
jgi:hypothetical protein